MRRHPIILSASFNVFWGCIVNRAFLRRLCLVSLLAGSFSLWAAEGNVLRLSPDVQQGDIYQPRGFWPLLGVGMGAMDSNTHIRSGGVPTHVKVLGSYYFQDAPWVADAGLGLHSEFLTQDGAGSDTIQSLYTELAARYQMTNRWQLGAIWNTLVDNPDRYRSNTDNLASFAGVQVMKEFTWNDKYLVRAGGRAMTDIGISHGTLNTLMGELEVSFGPDRQVAQAEPVQTAPAAPHLARHAMQSFSLEPGPVRFESDSTKIVSTSKLYLRHLARALAANHQLFDTVEVVGHADQRGTDVYNRQLSRRRALAISDSLVSAGVNRAQIHIEAKGKSELLTHSMAPLALARNRRVELKFVGVTNQAALKNVLDSVR
jgi:outer membrane protein OmpA-like peptidoglycan-associated protein